MTALLLSTLYVRANTSEGMQVVTEIDIEV